MINMGFLVLLQIIGVDPVGSQVAFPKNLNVKGSSQVEGIGKDFVPTVCDRRVSVIIMH